MNLMCIIFAFALFVFPIYAGSTIPPAYADCSTLPLYGSTGGPSIDDISALITDNGWFEADLAAVVLTNTSAIKQSLEDPEDGTVQVTLSNRVGQPQTMTFLKNPFPSDAPYCGVTRNSSSSAWVSAMYDGLTTLFKNDNISINQPVGPRVSRGLNAIQGTSGSVSRQSCMITSISGTRSPYALASSAPVVAAMYSNTTDPRYANRMVAVTASDSLNSSVNKVSFASISVFGRPIRDGAKISF